MSLLLLSQAVLGGVLAGGLYGLLALGLSLSWGLLRLVNLSHFALAFLSAYLTYHLGTIYGWPVWLSALAIIPLFFAIGAALHTIFVSFKVTEFASMLVTFGITVLIESLIQWYWTADYRKFESGLSDASIRIGPLFVPVLELAAFCAAFVLAGATWLWLNKTLVGKALRASAQDSEMASAFGINAAQLSYLLAGVCAAFAGVAGIFIALITTLSPAQIETWIGVVFAVVIIGGLGNPLGALAAGVLIGVAEAITMAAVNPAWAPLVAFAILIGLLLWRPKWL